MTIANSQTIIQITDTIDNKLQILIDNIADENNRKIRLSQRIDKAIQELERNLYERHSH